MARSHVAATDGSATSHDSEGPSPEFVADGSIVVHGGAAYVLAPAGVGASPAASVMAGAMVRAPSGIPLHILVDEGDSGAIVKALPAADLARIAALFDPSPSVWRVVGAGLVAVAPSSATMPSSEVPIEDPLVEQLTDAGVEVVVEGGVVIGEVLGLEVARIAPSPESGEPRLQVGVGAYDQEAFATINPDMPTAEGLQAVVDEVRHFRQPGAHPHPINRLVRERWVRAILIDDPATIGLRRLAAVPGLRPRNGLRDQVPAIALGTAPTGEIVVVVCSVGVDFELAPAAADAADRYGADRIIMVVPKQDQYPHVAVLAARLRVATTVVDAPVPWAAGNIGDRRRDLP